MLAWRLTLERRKMRINQDPRQGKSKTFHFPRWLTPFYFGVLIPVALILAPWACSLLTPHYGWVMGRPSVWQLFGLILVAAGIACIIWIIALHYKEAPEGWEFERTPKYLVKHGPYQFTRNPSFLSVLMIALGWALFYGSVSILLGAVLAWILFNFVVVPRLILNIKARSDDGYKSKVENIASCGPHGIHSVADRSRDTSVSLLSNAQLGATDM
jgi:protein-S-isoprenylcysteine O-methyltransferase Ste14